MERPRRHVFVTGAGFTRALVPDAPLLVDDFGNDALVKTVCGLPKASQFLEAERRRHAKGFINLERLMSRLDTLMPYDFDHKAVDEIAFLYSELKRSFLNTLASATAGKGASDDIEAFVAHWAVNGATCITFNYDDFLDKALLSSSSIWNPEWGYGFYCRSSSTSVSSIGGDRLPARSLLLKLHGSVNWRGLLGHEQPYALAAIVHHQEWGTANVPHLVLGSSGTLIPTLSSCLPYSPSPGLLHSRSCGLFGRVPSPGLPRPMA